MHENIIVIPSRARAEVLQSKLMTLDWAKNSKYPVLLVVPEFEVPNYKPLEEHNISVISSNSSTIAETYDEVMGLIKTKGVKKACFMDDDLIFAERLDFSKQSLTFLKPADSNRLFQALFEACSEWSPISSTRHRRFAHTEKSAIRHNRKLIGVLCCYVPVVSQYNFQWGQGSMYDHNMVLTLLREGYANTQLCNFTQDDALGYFAPGGCAEYRTHKTHSNSAIALENKFSEGVTLRDKYINGEHVFDVTIWPSKVFNVAKFTERFGSELMDPGV